MSYQNEGVEMSIPSPIPSSIDTNDISQFFDELGLVPYFGTTTHTSQTVLNQFAQLYALSVTHRACIDSTCTYAFEGNIKLIQASLDGIETPQENTDIPFSELQSIVNTVKELGFSFSEVSKLTKRLDTDLSIFGNAYLQMTISNVGSQYNVRFTFHPCQNVMYQFDAKQIKQGQVPERKVMISENFTREWVSLYKPQIIHTFPNYSKLGSGVISTVFHIKNESDKSVWYGRPRSLASFNDQYTQCFSSTSAAAKMKHDFVASYIMFMEKELEDLDPISIAKRAANFRQIATIQGGENAKSLIMQQYPNGGKTPTIEKLDVSRDTDYYKAVNEQTEINIVQSHGWDRALLGSTSASNGIGKDSAIISTLAKADAATIKPRQERFSGLWYDIFKQIELITGKQISQYQIQFPQRLSALIKEIKEANANTPVNTNTVPSNPV